MGGGGDVRWNEEFFTARMHFQIAMLPRELGEKRGRIFRHGIYRNRS